jgi:hypothetical protein
MRHFVLCGFACALENEVKEHLTSSLVHPMRFILLATYSHSSLSKFLTCTQTKNHPVPSLRKISSAYARFTFNSSPKRPKKPLQPPQEKSHVLSRVARLVSQVWRPVSLQGPTDVFFLSVFKEEVVERHEAGAPRNRTAQRLRVVEFMLSDVEVPFGVHCHDQTSYSVLVLGGSQPATAQETV